MWNKASKADTVSIWFPSTPLQPNCTFACVHEFYQRNMSRVALLWPVKLARSFIGGEVKIGWWRWNFGYDPVPECSTRACVLAWGERGAMHRVAQTAAAMWTVTSQRVIDQHIINRHDKLWIPCVFYTHRHFFCLFVLLGNLMLLFKIFTLFLL